MRRRWLWLLLALIAAILLVRSCVRFLPADTATGPRATPAAVRAGQPLRIPVQGVAVDMLRDSFTDARGQGRPHDAIDIVAPRGTPVIAAADGRVEKLFESMRGGMTIYVRSHDGRWIDYYAHLDHYAPGLREGQIVAAGSVIGAVGSSGDASPEAPHLHFAISRARPEERWYQGIPVNPYPLLVAGKR